MWCMQRRSVAPMRTRCARSTGRSALCRAGLLGALDLGGGIDSVHNAVSMAERVIERGASTLLIPVSARRDLNEHSDEMATKICVLFYNDARKRCSWLRPSESISRSTYWSASELLWQLLHSAAILCERPLTLPAY